MKKNVGSLDSMIRIIVAVVIALLFYFQVLTGTWAVILGAIAIILVITSLVNICPLYMPFGISTRRELSRKS